MFARRVGSPSKFLLLSLALILLFIPAYLLRYGWSVKQLKVVPDLIYDQWGAYTGSGEPSSELRRLCDQTTWTDGLWIHCHSRARLDKEGKASVHGGLNNVRNRIQTCLRVAIDAGAGVVMPSVATRNQTAIKALGAGEPEPVSNYWNMEHMTGVLGEQCPQLRVRFELPEPSKLKRRVDAPWRHYMNARYQAGTFRDMIVALLKRVKIELADVTPESQVAVSFGDTFLAWDYVKSGELGTIRKDLFKSLVYNQTLLDISSTILASPELRGGFIGIHLRAERDWPPTFGNIQDQTRLFTEEMEKMERADPKDLRTVYVSSGNRAGIQRFREVIEPLGYRAHDKWSLLAATDPALLARVERLKFDEKAVVEYQMLLKADFFLGLGMSTMSALIAYARALDDPANFFPTYIFPGSTKDVGEDGLGLQRTYPVSPIMKGDSKSRLVVVSGADIMDSFP